MGSVFIRGQLEPDDVRLFFQEVAEPQHRETLRQTEVDGHLAFSIDDALVIQVGEGVWLAAPAERAQTYLRSSERPDAYTEVEPLLAQTLPSHWVFQGWMVNRFSSPNEPLLNEVKMGTMGVELDDGIGFSIRAQSTSAAVTTQIVEKLDELRNASALLSATLPSLSGPSNWLILKRMGICLPLMLIFQTILYVGSPMN